MFLAFLEGCFAPFFDKRGGKLHLALGESQLHQIVSDSCKLRRYGTDLPTKTTTPDISVEQEGLWNSVDRGSNRWSSAIMTMIALNRNRVEYQKCHKTHTYS